MEHTQQCTAHGAACIGDMHTHVQVSTPGRDVHTKCKARSWIHPRSKGQGVVSQQPKCTPDSTPTCQVCQCCHQLDAPKELGIEAQLVGLEVEHGRVRLRHGLNCGIGGEREGGGAGQEARGEGVSGGDQGRGGVRWGRGCQVGASVAMSVMQQGPDATVDHAVTYH